MGSFKATRNSRIAEQMILAWGADRTSAKQMLVEVQDVIPEGLGFRVEGLGCSIALLNALCAEMPTPRPPKYYSQRGKPSSQPNHMRPSRTQTSHQEENLGFALGESSGPKGPVTGLPIFGEGLVARHPKS